MSSCLLLLAYRISRSGLLIAWFSGKLELGLGFPLDPDDIAGVGLPRLAVSGWPAALMTPTRAPRVSARGKMPDGEPFILASSSGRVEPWLERRRWEEHLVKLGWKSTITTLTRARGRASCLIAGGLGDRPPELRSGEGTEEVGAEGAPSRAAEETMAEGAPSLVARVPMGRPPELRSGWTMARLVS